MKGIIDQHHDRLIADLMSFLKYPSVSADSKYREGVLSCAAFLKGEVSRIGFEHATLIETPGFPVLYADWCHAPGQPTVLFYGHYDVQPPDPLDLWHTPPFEPAIRDGQIVARGVSDDKGQVYCHLKAFELLFAAKKALPVNVKLLIEGEEEVGSAHLGQVIRDHLDQLKADVVIASDTPMFDRGRPSICYSLRGLVYGELTVQTAATDLHSGQHGGAAPNAIQALIEIMSQLKLASGKVRIPGFYDAVVPVTPDVIRNLDRLGFDEEVYQKELGSTALAGEMEYPALARRWLRPTLDVNGIWGGYMGEGAKTVIPAKAHAKFSMRLVANQDPDQILKQADAYIRELAPSYAQIQLKWYLPSGKPVQTDIHHPACQAAAAAIKDVWGVDALYQGEGGSIPVIAEIKDSLGLDTVLLGFNLPNDKIHAPNEQFSVENYLNGIQVALRFYERLGMTST